ncbi:hypothetical protein HDU88_006028 [Geranomyces variabilis]|nr:hypothetical protein HDU88_006028 [Geranomyces variabilis]
MASLKTVDTFTSATRVLLRGREGAGVSVPPIACGTWAWGDKTWDYDEQKDMAGIQEVMKTLVEKDIAFLDTAEVYGSGESERIIGKLTSELSPDARNKVVIATKWLPIPVMPWRLMPRGIVGCLKDSLQRLGLESCDLYQVHAAWTLPYSHASVAKNLAECVKLGLAKTVGVSNYSKEQMIAISDLLEKEGVPLASNQIEYNLLRRLPESTGLIAAAHERGIVPLAYSPLAMGRLTGKYSAANPPSDKRKFSAIPMEEIEPLLVVMREIAQTRDVPVSAVALNWVLCKGAIPLGGARNGKQAEQNAQCLGWRLTDAEVQRLEAHSKEGTTSFWQKG